MDLWKELLINGLQNEIYKFDQINDIVIKEIIEGKCYKILLEIKQILNDDTLLDSECFLKIEKIIRLLEENNVYCDRHDFG